MSNVFGQHKAKARAEAARQRMVEAEKAKREAGDDSGLGWLTPVLSAVGTVGGAVVGGPAGAAAGSALLGGVGSLITGAVEGDGEAALGGATSAAGGLASAGGEGDMSTLFAAFERGRAAGSRRRRPQPATPDGIPIYQPRRR